MKRNIFILALFMLITAISFRVSAQNGNLEDVVYLKNGSIIRGTIIEQIPNESLNVKTKDGSVFVYKMTEVSKITKEQIANASSNTGNNNIGNQYANIASPSYKQIKMNYNYHMYVPQPSDPYNPIVSGVCSWFIPGLGQMICGETGRGLGFLGGYVGSYLVMGIGSGVVVNSYDDGGRTAGSLIMIVGAIGMVTVDIWSIVDASHVAKVKDMYVNDKRNKTSSLKLELSPYVDQISMNKEIVRPVGLTMRVKF
jgi:TM2 domain-containing membrane protein YozV